MMNEPTPKEIKETRLYAEWGLTDEEYHQIETILQREPNYTETGLFSVKIILFLFTHFLYSFSC